MGSVDVTVSIVNTDSRQTVLDSLAELHADETRASTVQIIVVDNASGDGSVTAIRLRFPHVEVVARQQRAGYGADHNLARSGTLAAIMSSYSTRMRSSAPARSTPGQPPRSPSHVGVAAPTLVDEDGAVQPSVGPRPRALLDVFGALLLAPLLAKRRRGSGAQAVGWAMGYALLVRPSAVFAAGGFDEGYFIYSEEIDL